MVNPVDPEYYPDSSQSLGRRIRDCFPQWGPFRWTVILVAALVLAVSGISLFLTPDYETVYSCGVIRTRFNESNTLVFVTLNIGNTGRQSQPDVSVLFSSEAEDHAILPPMASNFGVSERTIKVSTNANTVRISLGPIEAEKRVQLNLALAFPASEETPPWDRLFRGIEPARGKARKGDPDAVRYGRFLYSVFGG